VTVVEQLALEVEAPADPFDDLDVARADREAAARRDRDRADEWRPRRCECARPLVDIEDGAAQCVWCGRAVA
jgi:hypothetical protein